MAQGTITPWTGVDCTRDISPDWGLCAAASGRSRRVGADELGLGGVEVGRAGRLGRGKVGGHITYAGAHRLVDSGITGPEHVRDITRGSVAGILVTGVMRTLLFLAVLGVVAGGVTLAVDGAGVRHGGRRHAPGRHP